ncbi:BTB/POZ domain-containing protein kctd19 [Nowakowskiella sp. JEL0407]|nr:BTB/POZ domain-containing protein kctd19 [Nowakowskiella sp. JEL0407]
MLPSYEQVAEEIQSSPQISPSSSVAISAQSSSANATDLRRSISNPYQNPGSPGVRTKTTSVNLHRTVTQQSAHSTKTQNSTQSATSPRVDSISAITPRSDSIYHMASNTLPSSGSHNTIINNPIFPFVKLNVGGTYFQTLKTTFSAFPQTTLAKLMENNLSSPITGIYAMENEIFIDRDPELFKLILQLFRTRRLIIPSSIDPRAVQAELEYFGFPDDVSYYEDDPSVTRSADGSWGATIRLTQDNKMVVLMNGFQANEYTLQRCAKFMTIRLHKYFAICATNGQFTFQILMNPHTGTFHGVPHILSWEASMREFWMDFITCYLLYTGEFIKVLNHQMMKVGPEIINSRRTTMAIKITEENVLDHNTIPSLTRSDTFFCIARSRLKFELCGLGEQRSQPI